ncbi:P-loop NTPase [Halorubrum sp. BV1]|uniref:nucleotide-binding protein n=1 Tax=Halorubrum sp. BV1 TaxID=1498500 RepID=UPI000679960F|nr:P-loop NTPase [Halorubrum sp. BV1]
MATVYAVASAKGGVGKTTTTAAIATILADAGADVVAIDADIGMANLAEAVGVEPGETTLHDVLSGRGNPLDAVLSGPAGLRVLPGAADLDAYATADPSGLREVVAAFDDADYVFLDAGAGLSHDSTLPLGLADETLLVSTAERNALGDTEKTRQLTERLGGTVAGAAITRVGGDGATGDDLTRLDAPVLGRIPEDPAVFRAATANEPLVTFAPDAPATRAYRELARTLTGAEIPDPAPPASGQTPADAADPEPPDAADPEPPDAADPEPPDAAGESGETDDAGAADADGEDIIVADADSGGLGEPADERDIIVADESPVPSDESGTDSDSGEPAHAGPEDGDTADDFDGDTRTVGDDHVDGDDLEAMIEDEAGEAAFESEGSASADEGALLDEPEARDAPGEASEEEEPSRDIDDELAGSVPFRDDDTGTMNTVLSERSGADDDRDSTNGDDEPGDTERDESDDDTDGDGFFSRLFGR